MTTSPANWVIVPAAGIGRRMEADIPKQYLSLAGRRVIDHTIERTLLHPSIDGLYVALGPEDRWWPETDFASHPDLVRVDGGAERCHSVVNALRAMRDRAAPEDWVLVHDAARPCIRRDDIDRLVTTLHRQPVGGLLGLPVRDTMKRASDAAVVVETVSREGLWHAFTPQMFRYELLLVALEQALADDYLVTDEASAVEHAGYAPLMVEGHADNIKITRPEDLSLAEYYLSRQAAECPG